MESALNFLLLPRGPVNQCGMNLRHMERNLSIEKM